MCEICDGSYDPAVIYLDCSECKKIRTLPSELPNLKFLSVYNTNIEEIPPYASLEALYCFDSEIKELPRLPKLRKLVAQNTNLERLPEDCFRLEVVDIDNTNVSIIPESMISLRWLSADNTNIESVSKKLISLEWLSVAKTKISKMPKSMLSLQYLNCSGTDVSDIQTKGYPMLRKLACRGCPIDPFSFTNGLDVMM